MAGESARQAVRLLGVYARLDALALTRSPRRLLMFISADIVRHVALLATTLLLAERFDGLGPWSKAQVIFLLGYSEFVPALCWLFFGQNVMEISRRVGRGQLDHSLIQPRPLWLILATEGFNPFVGGLGLAPPIALLAWSAASLHLSPGWGWWALFFLNLGGSMLVSISFAYIWGSLAFWAPRGAEEISNHALSLLGEVRVFPLDGLGQAAQTLLLSAVPVGFLAWFPARALLGLPGPTWGICLTPLAAIAIGSLALAIFRKGLRHYEHTGSQRYLDYGHRR